MLDHVIKAKLIAYRQEVGNYTIYVFYNLDNTNPLYKYIMCVRFPNWQSPTLKIDDIGYLRYREVTAGEDSWYDTENKIYVPYNYTGTHFLNFILENKDTKDLII